MKFYILILIIFNSLFGQDNQKFVEANNLFKKGSYNQAIIKYEQIHNKSVECLFNIGNCYYKLDKFAYAIAYWKRALKYANNNFMKDIEYNISKAYAKLGKNFNQKSYFFKISIFYLQIILLSIWYLLFFFLKQIMRRKVYFVLVLLLNFTILGFIEKLTANENKKIGIITDNNAVIYAGPDANYHSLGILSAGDEVEINCENKNWSKIRCGNFNGWILTDFLRKIY